MRGPAPAPVVLAAGGTRGHVFPAEALAAALIRRGRRIVLFTDARTKIGPESIFSGYEHFVIPGGGIAGRGVAGAALGALKLGVGVIVAARILRRLRPAALVAFGGYPAIAPVLASGVLASRIPVILHEQNAVLGRANRGLARIASRLALSFAETERVPAGWVPAGRVTMVIGNPVRQAVLRFAAIPYAPPAEGEAIRLLVLGGSLGARVMSEVVPPALAALPQALRARLAVAQQCRAEDLARVAALYREAGIDARCEAFFTDVPERLASAHLVIARAGASTIAELAAIGRPAILVPLPGAIDDHQSANARAFGAGGVTIAQSAFTPARLAPLLSDLLADPTRLAAMAAAAKDAGGDAAERLADLTEAVLRVDAPGERGRA